MIQVVLLPTPTVLERRGTSIQEVIEGMSVLVHRPLINLLNVGDIRLRKGMSVFIDMTKKVISGILNECLKLMVLLVQVLSTTELL